MDKGINSTSVEKSGFLSLLIYFNIKETKVTLEKMRLFTANLCILYLNTDFGNIKTISCDVFGKYYLAEGNAYNVYKSSPVLYLKYSLQIGDVFEK